MPEAGSDISEGTAPERVSARELYRLRRTLLAAERLSLRAKLAENRARAALLALERRYGLLTAEARLDMASGRIIKEGSKGDAQ